MIDNLHEVNVASRRLNRKVLLPRRLGAFSVAGKGQRVGMLAVALAQTEPRLRSASTGEGQQYRRVARISVVQRKMTACRFCRHRAAQEYGDIPCLTLLCPCQIVAPADGGAAGVRFGSGQRREGGFAAAMHRVLEQVRGQAQPAALRADPLRRRRHLLR